MLKEILLLFFIVLISSIKAQHEIDVRGITCGSVICQNGGVCVNNACSCLPNYSGVDCSIALFTLQSNVTLLNQNVLKRMWNYYELTVSSSNYGLEITVDAAAGGDADLFVKKGMLPTRSIFDYRDNSQNTTFTLTIANQTSAGQWFIGVYGFTPVTYSITARVTSSCPNDCSNHGTCSNGVCTCNSGWMGQDCSSQLTVINFDTTYSSPIGLGQYVYYSIRNTVRRDIVVNVEQSSTVDVDLFVKFNDLPTYLSWDYKDISTTQAFSVPIPSAQVGDWYLGFYGYGQTTFSFNVTFSAPGCVSNCSGSSHGYCFNDRCVCGQGFSGSYCEEMTTPLQLNRHAVGQVERNAWNYYHVSSFTSNNLVITLNQTDNAEDCDLFVKAGAKPTRADFDFRDISLNALSSITINDPLDKVWYIGIDGFANCVYDIYVQESSQCPSNCNSRGTCNPNGQCICNPGYTGVACENVLNTAVSSQIYSGSLRSGEWAFYFYNATTSYVSFQLIETNSAGKLWLFISETGFPTTENYHMSETSVANPFHQIESRFFSTNPVVYYIGVYGNPYILQNAAVQFNFVAWSPPF